MRGSERIASRSFVVWVMVAGIAAVVLGAAGCNAPPPPPTPVTLPAVDPQAEGSVEEVLATTVAFLSALRGDEPVLHTPAIDEALADASALVSQIRRLELYKHDVGLQGADLISQVQHNYDRMLERLAQLRDVLAAYLAARESDGGDGDGEHDDGGDGGDGGNGVTQTTADGGNGSNGDGDTDTGGDGDADTGGDGDADTGGDGDSAETDSAFSHPGAPSWFTRVPDEPGRAFYGVGFDEANQRDVAERAATAALGTRMTAVAYETALAFHDSNYDGGALTADEFGQAVAAEAWAEAAANARVHTRGWGQPQAGGRTAVYVLIRITFDAAIDAMLTALAANLPEPPARADVEDALLAAQRGAD